MKRNEEMTDKDVKKLAGQIFVKGWTEPTEFSIEAQMSAAIATARKFQQIWNQQQKKKEAEEKP